ncbi:MAG: DUF559 domain-containing protein [Alphaproteobacteria bacterium]|nr:DUF559 domain-containing protein [Alphaproteobacteria bacterium]
MRLNEHRNTADDYRQARDLRNNASPVEKKLWVALREAAALRGLKFRRQQSVHPFIADFACMEARLLVELDGSSHDARLGYDKARDADLRQRGFHILRFSNAEVMENVEGIVEAILARAEQLIKSGGFARQLSSPLPNPPHEGEGTPAFPAEKEGQNVGD